MLRGCGSLASACRGGRAAVSRRFAGVVFDTRVGCDPVDLPRLTAVVRERLFETARVRAGALDDEADEDRPAVQRPLAEEFAAPVFELAGDGRGQGAARAVRKIEAPLASSRSRRSLLNNPPRRTTQPRSRLRVMSESPIGWT